MSDTYTKLFSSITESTVWGEPYATRVVWVSLLAMADARGECHSSVPGLARRANVTREEADAALDSFRAPDPDSRTTEHDGRRIEDIDGGWRLLNHAKYAAIRSAEERREYWRQHKAKSRAREDGCPPDVHTVHDQSTDSTESTPPALTPTPKKDQKKKKPSPEATALPEIPVFVDHEVWAGFVAMRTRTRHPLTARAAKLIHAELGKFKAAGHDPNKILDKSTRNGWRDVYSPDERNGNGNRTQSRNLSATERVAAACAAAEAAERSRDDFLDGEFTASVR